MHKDQKRKNKIQNNESQKAKSTKNKITVKIKIRPRLYIETFKNVHCKIRQSKKQKDPSKRNNHSPLKVDLPPVPILQQANAILHQPDASQLPGKRKLFKNRKIIFSN